MKEQKYQETPSFWQQGKDTPDAGYDIFFITNSGFAYSGYYSKDEKAYIRAGDWRQFSPSEIKTWASLLNVRNSASTVVPFSGENDRKISRLMNRLNKARAEIARLKRSKPDDLFTPVPTMEEMSPIEQITTYSSVVIDTGGQKYQVLTKDTAVRIIKALNAVIDVVNKFKKKCE